MPKPVTIAPDNEPLVLPRELGSVCDVHVSDKYRGLAEKYGATVESFFDRDENCFPTSGGTRKALADTDFILADVKRIADDYAARIVELTIFRLLETRRQSDRGRAVPTDSRPPEPGPATRTWP